MAEPTLKYLLAPLTVIRGEFRRVTDSESSEPHVQMKDWHVWKYHVNGRSFPSEVTWKAPMRSLECQVESGIRVDFNHARFWTRYFSIRRSHYPKESRHWFNISTGERGFKVSFHLTDDGHIILNKDWSLQLSWTPGMYCDEHNRLFWPDSSKILMERTLPTLQLFDTDLDNERGEFIEQRISEGFTPLGMFGNIPQFLTGDPL